MTEENTQHDFGFAVHLVCFFVAMAKVISLLSSFGVMIIFKNLLSLSGTLKQI